MSVCAASTGLEQTHWVADACQGVPRAVHAAVINAMVPLHVKFGTVSHVCRRQRGVQRSRYSL